MTGLFDLALSRQRESLADASSVELTRNPAGLISALQKLEANDKPFAKFDTHPPISERIAVLQRIEQGVSA